MAPGTVELPRRGRFGWKLAVTFAALLLASVVVADWWSCLPDDARATYVGRSSCVDCHQSQVAQWTGSHHDLAMDRATPDSVLGDFNDATLEHHGVTSRMFRRGDAYFVHTEGPDGRMQDFEVKYVLGVDPLQNYMVEFDRAADQPADELARLQVLRITWDVRGRRWFHLDPPDVKDKLAPDDPLHWTGVAQRWNTMCADCHSTNLRKNFDEKQLRYHTTFSEIDVSCEACHGPGSLHVELARAKSLFWDRKRGYGLARLKTESNIAQVETCAPCHSRRRVISSDHVAGLPYHDGHVNELLADSVYHADGQIQDEDYEYGSFLQSKMFHKNIRCSDCHNVHSTKLKHTGNQLCTSCHQHPAGKYDGPAHHHHQAGGPGASCVECHMPETTYMDVDPRRDHSIRVPRPSMSVKIGTPNACTRCHLDHDGSLGKIAEEKRAPLKQYADWLRLAPRDEAIRTELDSMNSKMAEAARRWWGDKADDVEHWGYAIDAARRQQPGHESALRKLATDQRRPAIVRATALQQLAGAGSPESLKAAERALADDDVQVRTAAIARFEAELFSIDAEATSAGDSRELSTRYRPTVRALQPLLADSRRAVRVEAARVLARVPDGVLRNLMDGPDFERYERQVDELLASLDHDSDRAGAHVGRAIVHESRGAWDAAEREYRLAIAVEPGVARIRTNLAALLDQRLTAAQHEAQEAAARKDSVRAKAAAEQAVKLSDEISKLRVGELALLKRDAELLPDDAGIQYRLGMALYLAGESAAAESRLLRAAKLNPQSPDAPLALALLLEKLNRHADALAWAEQLVKLAPDNPQFQAVRERIAAQIK
ncbi:MAG TPA: multiheme c-type cytochrome [Pirellulaceae bacterium]|nr:multiheme c-type cytochrome [Pirellulaceae bacterium]